MSVHDKSFKTKLKRLLTKSPESLLFIQDLKIAGELLFFGGSIRDIFLYPDNPPEPRDFDIAIKIKNPRKFEKIISRYDCKLNRFGGYKITISNISFDIWKLENTWAFNHANLEPSEENLAKSVYLNIDGIVYNYNKSILYDELLKSAILEGQLDINLYDNPQEELNLLRAIVFKNKYSDTYKLNYSNELRDVFKKHLDESSTGFVDKLYNIQNSHYHCEYYSKEELQKELQFVYL